MAEWKETHEVKSGDSSGSGVATLLAFLIGALLVALVAVFLLNAHGTVSGPAGHLSFNTNSPATVPTKTPAPHR